MNGSSQKNVKKILGDWNNLIIEKIKLSRKLNYYPEN